MPTPSSSEGFGGGTLVGVLDIESDEPSATMLQAIGAAGQTGDLVYIARADFLSEFEITPQGDALLTVNTPTYALRVSDQARSLFRIIRAGGFSFYAPAAVGATELTANHVGFGLDPTPAATKLKITAKDSAGTLVSADIALA